MPNRAKRGQKKRKVTGSRRQRIVKSDTRHGLLGFAGRWWWIGVAIVVIAVLGLSISMLGGCGNKDEETSTMLAEPSARVNMYSGPPEMKIDPSRSYVATISTPKGDIVASLDASAAPLTVNNFVFLAREGFYDGLTFHRVEPGFVVQGGDPAGTGSGGPGYQVDAEIGLSHVEGALATARLGDGANPERRSSGSQFYITLAPTPFLDGAYTVFGQVTEGMDVVKALAVGDLIDGITIVEGD